MESPVGVYLRREIFKKETRADTASTRKLYDKTVVDQSTDGSWGRKEQETETFLVLDALKNATSCKRNMTMTINAEKSAHSSLYCFDDYGLWDFDDLFKRRVL